MGQKHNVQRPRIGWGTCVILRPASLPELEIDVEFTK